jgi:hypothetical protein
MQRSGDDAPTSHARRTFASGLRPLAQPLNGGVSTLQSTSRFRPGQNLFSFRLRSDSHNLDLVEFGYLEFCRGAARQYRKLVQREFVLVIAAGDEAVHGNHAIIAKGSHGGGGSVHNRLVARSAANNRGLDAALL